MEILNKQSDFQGSMGGNYWTPKLDQKWMAQHTKCDHTFLGILVILVCQAHNGPHTLIL